MGEDTGTPVIEDYAAQMPFKFTGKLEKLTIDLAPQNLSAKEQREIEESETAAAQAAE